MRNAGAERDSDVISDGDAVAQAWRALRNHDIDQPSVLDESGRLAGFVSRSDILRAVVTGPSLSL